MKHTSNHLFRMLEKAMNAMLESRDNSGMVIEENYIAMVEFNSRRDRITFHVKGIRMTEGEVDDAIDLVFVQYSLSRNTYVRDTRILRLSNEITGRQIVKPLVERLRLAQTLAGQPLFT